MHGIDPNSISHDFQQAVALAGVSLDEAAIRVELLAAPHKRPGGLPKEKMAVYVFSYKGQALKVGKAGPKSQARYVSQHYIAGSAPSTLAASLLMHGSRIGIAEIDAANLSEWITKNTDRYNFILDAAYGPPVLTMLEAFVQCRLRPAFEGCESQRQC